MIKLIRSFPIIILSILLFSCATHIEVRNPASENNCAEIIKNFNLTSDELKADPELKRNIDQKFSRVEELPKKTLKSASSCCGPVTEEALKLDQFYDQTNVESLWKNGIHVDWQTGASDKPLDYQGPDRSSHCSAFVASVNMQLGVYILRPPEHPETFLASAQSRWLKTTAAQNEGWIQLKDMKEAQSYANLGKLVVAAFISPEEFKPGHIAIVRSSEKSIEALNAEGPQIIQAGKYNYNSTSVSEGFKNHKDAFPNEILYFSHPTPQI